MYQFRRKGNEHQFNFNCGVEDAIASVKTELSKAKPTDSSTSEAVKKAELYLDEGSKALATQQKHIKIADHSDLSWTTVNHYMADPLANGPEDEKEIATVGLKTRPGASPEERETEWQWSKEGLSAQI